MLKWLTAKKSPSAVPAAEAGTALAALFEPTGAPALAELPPPPPPKPEGRGRLIFALDATASRAPTWVEACRLQAAMFEATAGLGELRSQLVYYRAAEQRASDWVGSAEALLQLMRRIWGVRGIGGESVQVQEFTHDLLLLWHRIRRYCPFGASRTRDVDSTGHFFDLRYRPCARCLPDQGGAGLPLIQHCQDRV